MPGNRAALSLVPDEPDREVPRLGRLPAPDRRPEVLILLRGGPCPRRGWAGVRSSARRCAACSMRWRRSSTPDAHGAAPNWRAPQ